MVSRIPLMFTIPMHVVLDFDEICGNQRPRTKYLRDNLRACGTPPGLPFHAFNSFFSSALLKSRIVLCF